MPLAVAAQLYPLLSTYHNVPSPRPRWPGAGCGGSKPNSNVSCGPPSCKNTALPTIYKPPPILYPIRPVAHPPEAQSAWATTPAPLKAAIVQLNPQPNIPSRAHRSSTPAETQRAPRSCSPPHGVASDCATLSGRQNSAQFFAGSGCALRGWAEGPARKPGDSSRNRATRSRPKARTKASAQALPRVRLTAAPIPLRRLFPRALENLIQKRGTLLNDFPP